MVHVVEYAEFDQLVRRVERLEAENTFLKGLLAGQQWMSRSQAMLAIDCSDTTLWKLTKEGRLTYRKEGRKIHYEVDCLRRYLQAKRIEAYRIDERVLRAFHTRV